MEEVKSKVSGSYDKARILLAEALEVDPESLNGNSGVESLEAWDSLGHLRIVTEIESQTGAELSPEQVLALSTLDDIATLLDQLSGAG